MTGITSKTRLSVKRAKSLVETGADIWGTSTADNQQMAFVHALHAHVYFPRAQTVERVHRHKTGRALLSIQAGDLVNPKTQDWEEQPLPYGSIPRALQAYIATQAIRQRSTEIEIGASLSDFVKMMDGSVSGGPKGNLNRWKKQLNALAAARIQLGWVDENRARQKNIQIIEELELWASNDPNQKTLWPEVLKLSDQYLHNLLENPLPIDMRAIREIRSNTMATDIYLWLAYRLFRINKPDGEIISWKLLKEQFGPGYSHNATFKRRFLEALNQAVTVYPDARMALSDERKGLVLKHCAPPVSPKIAPILVT